ESYIQTITPAERKRTESFLPLELSNRFNVLSSLLVSHGAELNSRYTDAASDKMKELHTELTDARVASIGLLEELSQTDAKLSDKALVVRDLQNQLILERAKSQGYKDAVDGKLPGLLVLVWRVLFGSSYQVMNFTLLLLVLHLLA
ncbi:hypothetical protein Tco_1511478, partial [Tanacetum coccineum]